MINRLAIVVILVFLVFFLLSVFAPMQSPRRFWRVIHKIRAGMDFFAYWFINICALLIIATSLWNLLFR